MAFNSIYKLVFFIICIKVFCISALYAVLICASSLSLLLSSLHIVCLLLLLLLLLFLLELEIAVGLCFCCITGTRTLVSVAALKQV